MHRLPEIEKQKRMEACSGWLAFCTAMEVFVVGVKE